MMEFRFFLFLKMNRKYSFHMSYAVKLYWGVSLTMLDEKILTKPSSLLSFNSRIEIMNIIRRKHLVNSTVGKLWLLEENDKMNDYLRKVKMMENVHSMDCNGRCRWQIFLIQNATLYSVYVCICILKLKAWVETVSECISSYIIYPLSSLLRDRSKARGLQCWLVRKTEKDRKTVRDGEKLDWSVTRVFAPVCPRLL